MKFVNPCMFPKKSVAIGNLYRIDFALIFILFSQGGGNNFSFGAPVLLHNVPFFHVLLVILRNMNVLIAPYFSACRLTFHVAKLHQNE